MGSEDWVIKVRKFDNKYQKPKIENLEQRLDSQKYNIKKQNKVTKIKKYIYEVCFKNKVFFFSR